MKATNIDGLVKEFATKKEFIKYVQLVWEENENDGESDVECPLTEVECIGYISLYTEIELSDIYDPTDDLPGGHPAI